MKSLLSEVVLLLFLFCYFPAVDVDTGLPAQVQDPDVVTVVEKWESVQALRDHLQTPHMLSYRKQVQDLVEDLSLKVL